MNYTLMACYTFTMMKQEEGIDNLVKSFEVEGNYLLLKVEI